MKLINTTFKLAYGKFDTTLLLTFVLTFFLGLNSQAQAPSMIWENTMGGTGEEYPNDMVSSPDGGSVILGHSSSPSSPDKSSSPIGSTDLWVVKLDNTGAIEWEKTIGTTTTEYGAGIANATDGYFISAYYQGGGSGSGNKVSPDYGAQDIWVLKLDFLGNIVWEQTMGTADYDVIYAIDGTPDGGCIIGAVSNGNATFPWKAENSIGSYDFWLIKLDSDGNLEWENTIGGTGDENDLYGLKTLSDGYILGGVSNSNISGDKSENPIGGAGRDFWIIRTDLNGNILWENTIGTSSMWGDQIFDLDIASNGGFVITGNTDAGIDNDKTEASNGANDFWIIKLSETGIIEWDKSIGGSGQDYPYALTVDTDGGYVVSGESSSPISGHKSQAFIGGGSDYWVVKLDVNGNFLWDLTTGGTLYEQAWRGIATTPSGVVVTGTSQSNMGGDKSENCLGNYDFWSFMLTPTCVTVIVPDVTTLPNVTGECSATITTAPTATDNCAGTITGTTSDPLTYNSQGTFTIEWTYDAGNGNTLTQSQTVIIDDVSAPMPDEVTLNTITGECSASITTAPTATDNCVGMITGTTTDPLTYATQGTFTVNWTFDDGLGNLSTQTQTVIVDDISAPSPEYSILPNILAECEVQSLTQPVAYDDCEGIIFGTHDVVSLPITSQGTTVITWTYTDAQGNSSTQTQNVIINDITNPVPVVATLPDVMSECEVLVLSEPTANDNCGLLEVTHNATLPITTIGTTIVTWTYTDLNGNTSTQDQNVIINSYEATLSLIDEITLTVDEIADSYKWIDCDNGNQVIAGEVGQTFMATANGNYAAIVTSGSCIDTTDCIAITTVGNSQVERISLSLYPNPVTNGEVFVQYDGTILNVEVVDLQGRKINASTSSDFKSINIQNIESGKYFIQIDTDKGSIMKGFIVIK